MKNVFSWEEKLFCLQLDHLLNRLQKIALQTLYSEVVQGMVEEWKILLNRHGHQRNTYGNTASVWSIKKKKNNHHYVQYIAQIAHKALQITSKTPRKSSKQVLPPCESADNPHCCLFSLLFFACILLKNQNKRIILIHFYIYRSNIHSQQQILR